MGVDILDFLKNNEELVSKIVLHIIGVLVNTITKRILEKKYGNKKK